MTIAGQFTRLCKHPSNADAKYVLNCLYNAGICSSGSSRPKKEYCIVHDYGQNWLFGYMLDNKIWFTDGLRSIPQEQVSFPNRNLRWLYSPDAEESDIDPMLIGNVGEPETAATRVDEIEASFDKILNDHLVYDLKMPDEKIQTLFEEIRKEETRHIRVLLLAAALRPCNGNFRTNGVSAWGAKVKKLKHVSNTNAIKFLYDEVFVAFASGQGNMSSQKWWLGFTHKNKVWCSNGIQSVPFDSIELCGLKLRLLKQHVNVSGLVLPIDTDIDPMLIQKLREIGKSSQEIDELKRIILDPNLFQVSMIFLSIHNDKSPTCFVFNRASRLLQSRASSQDFPSNRAMLMQSMFSTASAMQHFNRWVICLSSESTSLFLNQH